MKKVLAGSAVENAEADVRGFADMGIIIFV